ncbi:glutamate receptor ionotropic, kainate 2 [Teleopsis dalmanni]|uniref:glutamate receptor ionotropic, kainate 2 n=1 Tax=Teleopsis dalmanni TaxID=139649 RepID=UPI0018CFD6D2|nr:glutamate receptor ionotropic, kainate 2 [Teleopsis dalmanni]
MLLIKLILLVLTTGFVAGREQFFIGAIFSSDNHEAEIAFHTAIERVNIYDRNVELVPIVEYVNADDSFIIEKTVCGLISKGVIALFGPNNGGSSEIIASICNTLDLPHIIYDWTPSEAISDREHSTMTLNVYPDNLQFARGIAEIVQSFGWRSFTVVYESENELQQLQDVLQISEPDGNPITILQLGTDLDYRPFLKSIKLSTDSCLILHVSIEKILNILRQANELKMLGEYQSIFLPQLDAHTLDLQELELVSANITTVRLMDPTDFHVKNVVHDWEEREKRESRYYRVLPEKVKTNMILINDAVWIFSKGLTELGITEKLRTPNIECHKSRQWALGRRIIEFMRARSEEAATGRIDFNEHGERSYFTLRCMELSSTGFLDLATWDPVNRVELLTNEAATAKRLGEKISNKTFIITSRIGAPFLSEREPQEGETLEGNARYEGYSMDLIDAIAKLLKFKYEFHLTPDKKYGSLNKQTKQWDGLVKQLLDGNADLGICDLTMTSSRRMAVDFTPPFMTLGISILYKKPSIPDTDLFSFLLPFSLDVWIYMATASLFISLLLLALSRMAPDDWENPHPCKEPEEVENVWCITNTTWLTMGSLMGQGCDLLPKAASTRLVTGMWWFFALMMLNSYTANLAAFLTMSRMESSINSAEDLAAQNKIKYGAVLGGSTLSFFKESNFSTFQRMWASMDSATPSVFTKSNDEGVERVMKGKGLYAFLMESTTLEYIIERKCELMQVGGWLDYKTYGIAMPFNSPYRKEISGAVLKLGESGTLAELKRKWWKEMHGGGSCTQTSKANVDTPELEMENVGGVFLVLGIGLLSAIAIGVVEFLWNVKAVAIEEKISLGEALKLETLFALKVWIVTKPVRGSSDNSSSSSSSSKSSSKSLGLSTTHSLKSIKSSAEGQLSVHDRLRKISSMFSLKSFRSERIDGDTNSEKHDTSQIDKGTQMSMSNEKKHHQHQNNQ